MPKSKEMCKGCHDDFYNHQQAKGCWSFEKAKVVQRVKVGTWDPPPYGREPEDVLSCCHIEGCSLLELDDCRLQRNWKEAVAP